MTSGQSGVGANHALRVGVDTYSPVVLSRVSAQPNEKATALAMSAVAFEDPLKSSGRCLDYAISLPRSCGHQRKTTVPRTSDASFAISSAG